MLGGAVWGGGVGGGAGVGSAVLASGVSTLSEVWMLMLPVPRATVPPMVTEPLAGAVQVPEALRTPNPLWQSSFAQEPAEAPIMPVDMRGYCTVTAYSAPGW